MKFNVISLFPELIENFVNFGVTGRAIKEGKVDLHTFNPRAHSKDIHNTVDDRPYGGGDGMVMLAENLALTLEEVREKQGLGQIIYLSPQGRVWKDEESKKWAQELSTKTLICGRYGGVDQRVLQKYDIEEVSIGDYVLSGGELAALVIIDSVLRKIPGVLGNEASAKSDSFSHGGLLEAPLFTRPSEWQNLIVPEVLLSGHHEKIDKARSLVSLVITAMKRPDIIENKGLQKSVREAIHEVRKWETQDLKAWGLNEEKLELLRGKYA